ncbi:hypothetical protein J6590_007602 [Homalodisca vitripennis]|nr:hypothetical protein J6590_007602 [Homalodisca vitripennis]
MIEASSGTQMEWRRGEVDFYLTKILTGPGYFAWEKPGHRTASLARAFPTKQNTFSSAAHVWKVPSTSGSAARDPHGIKQITVGPPHGIKQITMFIRENVEFSDEVQTAYSNTTNTPPNTQQPQQKPTHNKKNKKNKTPSQMRILRTTQVP